MNLLPWHWLKSREVFPESALPDMRLRDLAQAPATDPVLRAVLQMAYLDFEEGEMQLMQPALAPGEREYWSGYCASLRNLVKNIEDARVKGKTDPGKELAQ